MLDSVNTTQYILAGTQAAQNQLKKNEKTSKTPKSVFSQLLKEAEEEKEPPLVNLSNVENLPFDSALEVLQDTLMTAADDLKQHPVPENVEAYKKAVGSFIAFVSKNAYSLSEKARAQKNGVKPPPLYTIEVINSKLDRLASDILFNQKREISLVARVDEITGLVVNLLA